MIRENFMKKKTRNFHKNKIDFFETHQGQVEYDNELARIRENRRRIASFIKSKGGNQSCSTKDDRD